ncbi:putative mediator of RNA polymerase II transcription subunit 26 [Drosophila hydei]|uniref:Mediator of RNA polymerase II transcription subunit 26 n=1 Tax=Drosophila hydei TaxID=7224 RepID=A0A6J1M2V2_DROHY|nr:putative mediator of RNA polymerase II transcription subunit 26 [Drosophila hydei]XP_023173343.2 putative mediator of RNA polymerase II transcription subunit 26 [Drosophila hydei]
MLILLALLSIFGNSLIAGVEANLSLGFKVIRLPRHINPANCSVGNTTFAHGATFKLDCKTQCVCENGRHACSTLCPNEQLPAPEDTISCRSPRLVEVPGHCCKMWLCENPTADVYATCHNSSISGNWSACSRACGLGMATRQTSTHAGCHQLSNLRLCENRRCVQDNKRSNSNSNSNGNSNSKNNANSHNRLFNNLARSQLHQLHHHKRNGHGVALDMQQEPAHRIRKGHECRSLQRLGTARIRLGECVSRKLYRPKLCGSCHRGTKCCIPAVSTTIQVELLCPLNAVDPINYVQKRMQQDEAADSWQPEGQLWNTIGLEPIDQEFLQSHQIQIENKFVAIEWILKCECSKNFCSADKNRKLPSNATKYAKHSKGQQKERLHATKVLQNELKSKYDELQDVSGYEVEQQQQQQQQQGANVRNAKSNEENSSSEQQPDIIPYPLGVGEISWKKEKRQRKEKEEAADQGQQWQQRT